MQTLPIAVFGSSEPGPADPLYRTARRVGTLLAEAGYGVITGAYGGVMEAANRGAQESGGASFGVGCAIFSSRKPNPYLDEIVIEPDLHLRTRTLIERARGFVVLAGKSGTLAELSMLWALDRAGCHAGRPVVLLGDPWDELLCTLARNNMLEPSQQRITRVAHGPEDAVSALSAALRPTP
jgi:uncharacterized protein (TIGR00730 family)